MTKTILALALTMTLFGGIALADDGNMGGGGYTPCGGTNPPPTCPPSGGGFADLTSSSATNLTSGSDASGITLRVSEMAVEVLNLAY